MLTKEEISAMINEAAREIAETESIDNTIVFTKQIGGCVIEVCYNLTNGYREVIINHKDDYHESPRLSQYIADHLPDNLYYVVVEAREERIQAYRDDLALYESLKSQFYPRL